MSSMILTERVFAETIAANGGRVYRVGGCVRDIISGNTPKDMDFCVVGMVKRNFKALFPDAEECGKYFPVFRLPIDGAKSEIAFARTERKSGSGYKGFTISSNPKITIEDDLFRRDTTVNSIAIDSLTGGIIDPFHGIEDIRNKILRATSRHFSDDPMRAMRLARQSAQLGYAIDGETLTLASAAAGELAGEPVARIFAELVKVLAEAREPARFFKVLSQISLLQIAFPEIADLASEKFNIAMARLDAVAKASSSLKLRFATLGLVMEKASLFRWNNRMTLPADWLSAAVVAGNVMALLSLPDPENIVAAIQRLRRGSLSPAEFDSISQAAELNLPALSPLIAVMTLPAAEVVPDHLKGEAIGKWIIRKQTEAIAKAWEK